VRLPQKETQRALTRETTAIPCTGPTRPAADRENIHVTGGDVGAREKEQSEENQDLERLLLRAGNLLKPIYAMQIALRCVPCTISRRNLLKDQEGGSGSGSNMCTKILSLLELMVLDSEYATLAKRSIEKLLCSSSSDGSNARRDPIVHTALEYVGTCCRTMMEAEAAPEEVCKEGAGGGREPRAGEVVTMTSSQRGAPPGKQE